MKIVLAISTSGIRVESFVFQRRFKSLPKREVLKLPATTPSGLSMGIITKSQCFKIFMVTS